jgi:metal-responsive CopG/Arc/MetJ family transcriptional regulator
MGEHNNAIGMPKQVIVLFSLNLHADYVITNTITDAVADTQQEEHNNVVGMAEQHLRTDNVTEIQLVESDHEDEMQLHHLSHS